jgi:hypothetical protein
MAMASVVPAVGLSVVLMAVGAAAPSGAAPPGSGPPARQVQELADPDRYVAALEKRGFEVAEGGFTMWTAEQCPDSFSLMGTCYFNNPTAPYDLPLVPHWDGEFVDPATAGALGPVGDSAGTVFRLDPNEAILVFGELPPPAAYFGLQPYLFTHEGTWSTDNDPYRFITALGAHDIFFHEVPQNTARIGTFDSITDSVNNVVVERQSGSSWGQLRYFVISPDRYMDKQVRQVLHRLDVDRADVFSQPIPGNLRLGLDPSADEFTVLVRYSLPEDGGGDGSASQAWREHPTLRVLRIRDNRIRPPQTYPDWMPGSPAVRGGVSEAHLADDVDALAYAVSETWDQPCADGDCVGSGAALPFIDTQSAPMDLVGAKCLTIGMDCVGDTQDATYQFRPGLSFDDDEVYAVVGTLGTTTGNATYVSLGVNNIRLRLGTLNVDGDLLAGSAASYGVPNSDHLYVHYFTRDCSDLYGLTQGRCTEVGTGPLELPSGDLASLVERDYIAPGTERGPESTLTVPSLALRLQRPTG